MATTTSKLEELQQAERLAQQAYVDADAALTAGRARLTTLEQRWITAKTTGDPEAVATLGEELSRLSADVQRQAPVVDARYTKARNATAARADAERETLAEQSEALAREVEQAVGAAMQTVNRYLDALTKYQQVLRDAPSFHGSIAGTPGFAKPSGAALALTKAAAPQRGIVW